ncbi:MAG TPA: GMC family oxidoreductase N-terminal domain-containing protein [Gemmatimonadaceae bacterium]|nr:GMC family oxidoreductase N-terminal domain-containing protein [Gemmatimonadaceae bacterium]
MAADSVDGIRDRRYVFPVPSPAPTTSPKSISFTHRATLIAAARRIVPHAFKSAARGEALVAAIAGRIERLAPPMRQALETALDLLGNRWATLATGHHPLPFHLLSPDEQERLLARWTRARVGSLRTVVQAIRRLVLLVEYATPEAHEEIGYRGPYFKRGPQLDWEGPLEGVPNDQEPVARGPRTTPVPRPRVARWGSSAPDGGAVIRAGVVVVGSGAGGAVAAAHLAEAGHDVVVLEEGEPLDRQDFDENESVLPERLYADGGLRSTDDLAISLLQGATLGGGTTVNWMVMLRTPDWVLDEWSSRHGTEGMTARDLAPVFDCIEHDVHARIVPADAHSPNNRVLLEGARALGWAARSARVNARDCLRTGFCGYGCRYGAKQGALEVFLPRAVAAGARVASPARADRIEFVERGGAFPLKRVHVTFAPREMTPRAAVIEAPVVIVAAGAVGTPVLLQRSGLAGDGVGRYLRLHPTTALMGTFDHEIYGASGIPLSAICDEHQRHDANGYGFWLECPPMHPVLAAVAIPGFGAEHREQMLRFRQHATLIALVRDGADLDASSGEVSVGRGGRVRIRYRLGPRDSRHLVEAVTAGARLHLAAGAREVHTLHASPLILRSERDLKAVAERAVGPNDIGLFSAHVNGTCRLGAERPTSGTDPHGERYGAPGVFVADGSLLPTAPGVNPQETIMALATIVAARIAARRRPG